MKDNKKKVDPRILRTRSLLRNAMIDLIPEKGFDEITVQDITDRATLNRATFYLHFHDKHELLMDTFETLFNEVTPQPLDISQVSPAYAQLMLEKVFEHISRYADFYCRLLGKDGDSLFIARVREYVHQVVMNWFQFLQPEESRMMVSMDVVTNFLGSAYMGVILWWLEHDMPHSPEYMAGQLLQMTVNGVPHLLGLGEDKVFESMLKNLSSD